MSKEQALAEFVQHFTSARLAERFRDWLLTKGVRVVLNEQTVIFWAEKDDEPVTSV
jgi:hypothetical protein